MIEASHSADPDRPAPTPQVEPVPPSPRPVRPLWFRMVAALGRTAFFWQLGCVLAYHVLEYAFADHWFFAQLNRVGAIRSHAMLGSQWPAQKIAIVDISRLNGVHHDGSLPGAFLPPDTYTPRPVLTALLNRLFEYDALAVGFDLDFSGDQGVHAGRPPVGHGDFIRTCLLSAGLAQPDALAATDSADARFQLAEDARRKARPMPVFLGVHRSAFSPHREEWLGGAEFAPLAAAISVLSDSRLQPPFHSLIPYQIHVSPPPRPTAIGSTSTATIVANLPLAPAPGMMPPHYFKPAFSGLPSLSAALANVGQPPPPRSLLADAFLSRHVVKRDLPGGARAHIETYYADFHNLRHTSDRAPLIDAERLLGKSADLALRDEVAGRLVIVGAADPSRTPDKHLVPDDNTLIPGVYLHAIGTMTRQQHTSIDRLRAGWEVFCAFALAFLVGESATRLAARHGFSVIRAELCALLVTIGLFALIVWAFAALFHVLWPAWLAAIIGFCLETAVQLFRSSHHAPDPASTP